MDYNEICRYIGKLYLETQIALEKLSRENFELLQENQRLKDESKQQNALQDNQR